MENLQEYESATKKLKTKDEVPESGEICYEFKEYDDIYEYCSDVEDGCSLDSINSSDLYPNDDFREEADRYREQLMASDGFDLDFTPQHFPGNIRRVEDPAKEETLIESFNFAIEDNNKNPKRPKLKPEGILKANVGSCAGRMYYITFKAENLVTGKLDIYQTKVYYGIKEYFGQDDKEVLIFRPQKLNKE